MTLTGNANRLTRMASGTWAVTIDGWTTVGDWQMTAP